MRSLTCTLLAFVAISLTAGEAPTAAAANNAFASNLYAQLNKTPGNVLFSPYSIHTALGMTHEGAGGATLDEMRKVLQLSEIVGSAEIVALMNQLNAAAKQSGAELNVANALWGQKGYPFVESFLERTLRSYQAQLQPWDFEKDLEGGRLEINRWVEAQTKDKIKELLKPNALPPLTRMVLVNAIYFNGKWAKPFDANATKPDAFAIDGGGNVQVPLMRQTSEMAHFQGDGFQLVRVPYANGAFDMTVILPEVGGLEKLSAQLSAENISKWLAEAQARPVNLWLPKFKMTGSFELKAALSAMGMSSAFSRNANFSRMCPDNNLAIDKVVHQAFIDVNEAGTEAAAATAIMVKPRGLARPTPAATVRVDHSFVFLLTERTTNAVLFMGRVVDPTK